MSNNTDGALEIPHTATNDGISGKQSKMEGQKPLPNKKYQPRFQQSIQLPSIKQFRLDYILNHELKNESQQVINNLLKTSSNYRNDLKNEIRLKLSIEQKLQNKNIEIAQLAGKLTKIVNNDNKSMNKVLYANGEPSRQESNNNLLDEEVLKIFNLSLSLSDDFARITRGLQNVQEKLGVSDVSFKDKYPLLFDYFNKPKDIPSGEVDIGNASENIINVSHENTDTASPVIELTNTSQQIYLDENMTTEDFEAFMSQTLNNYRKVQQERYGTMDIFQDQGGLDNLELFNNPHFDNSLSSVFHKSENPVDLLMDVSVKAPATVDQTFQVSHFKKLRINGAPITPKANSKTSFAKNGLGIGTSYEENRHLPNGMDLLKSLTSTNSNGTSGLALINSEDEISDAILSSESSDSDSSLEMSSFTGDTQEYYNLLRKDLKIKKKLKRPQLRSENSNYIRNTSPNPKHEPSHHTLKPKGSILKHNVKTTETIKTNEFPVNDIVEDVEVNSVNSSPIHSTLNPMTSRHSSGVENFTAQGIILGDEADQVIEEIANWDLIHDMDYKSISKLKSFVTSP